VEYLSNSVRDSELMLLFTIEGAFSSGEIFQNSEQLGDFASCVFGERERLTARRSLMHHAPSD